MSGSTVTGLATRPNERNDGTTTIWIPLTTVYPSSSVCAEDFWMVYDGSIVAWDPGYGRTVDSDVICQPTQMTTWWNANEVSTALDLSVSKLSIGPIVCPAAYKTVTTSEFDWGDGETSTLVACCPKSYDYSASFDRGNPGECTSSVSSGQVLNYVSVDLENSTNVVTSTTMESSSVVYAAQVNGWLFPQTSTSDASTRTTLSTEATVTETEASSESNSGLSTGAKAGIGVGVGAAVLGLVAMSAFLFFRRRNRKHAAVPQGEPYVSPSEVDGGMGAVDKANVIVPPYTELPAQRQPVELPGR